MRKTRLLKHFLLLFALIAGSTSVWAEDSSYTITFKDSGNSSDGSVKRTTIEDIISDGASYVSSITNVSNVYNARTGRGIKLGTSSANGSLTLNLASAVKPTKITFLARKYNDSELSITVNSLNVTDLTGDFDEYTVNYDGNTVISSIAISTPTNRAYITQVTVYYQEGDIPPVTTYSVTYDCNGGTSGCPENLSGVSAGSSITLAAAPTKTDNTFAGWNDGTTTYDAGDSYTVNSDVTFTAQWTPTGGGETGDESWVETSLADLTENDVFVIVGNNGANYAMSNDKGTTAAPTAVSVTVSDNKLTGTIAENIKWNISGNATDGYTFFPNGSTTTWLYCTSDNNGVRVGTTNSNDYDKFKINSNYIYNIGRARYLGIYSSSDWRCYTSINSNISGQTFAFYKKVTGDVLTPSIVANDVELAYDETSGEIAFTINNPVETPSVTGAFTSANWISEVNFSLADGKVTFTTTENTGAARTATIELRYDVATKVVNVTQAAAPAVISTIPALFDAATTTAAEVQVTFDNWVVSGVSTNGKNVFVTDGTNGFVIYSSSDQSNIYAVGNILSGTAVSCKLQLYNGFAEITNLNASDLTITTGGTVSVADIAMANLAGINTGALVSYENLTCSVSNNKYYLSDGTTTLQVYNALFAFDALEDGKTYNITGIYQQYNNTKEILPRSADDIEEVVSTEASIAVDPTTVNVDADGGVGTITVTYNNITEVVAEVYFCDADGEAVAEGTYSWVTAEINSDNNVEYRIDANEGEARTAYMMVYAFDDDVNGVYSDLITITQAKYVEATTYSLVTSVTPGKHYIIASGTDGNIYVMGAQKSTNRNAVAITANNGKIAVTPDKQVCEFLIEEDYLDFYTIYDASYNENAGGYLYAAGGTGSNHLKTQTTNNQNGEWTISIDDEGVATIKANMTGRNWMRFNNGNSKLFSCYTDGQQDIYLFERDNDDSPEQTTIAVAPAHEYITFCSTKALDFAHVEGLEAYIVTKVNETSVSIQKIETAVPAGTGLILKKTGTASSFDVPVVAEATAPAGNKLTGVTEPTLIGNTNATDYILFDGKFYPASQGTLPAGKAYLRVEEGNAPELGLDFSGETTGIVNVNRETITNNQYYTLDGRRVENPTNGIYIINGRKVVVK